MIVLFSAPHLAALTVAVWYMKACVWCDVRNVFTWVLCILFVMGMIKTLDKTRYFDSDHMKRLQISFCPKGTGADV